jgi:hypothetical protein
MEHSFLYARGPYRIVAIDGRDDSISAFGAATGYAVIDSAGTPLRLEPSLDDAKAWIHAQTDAMAHDANERKEAPVPTRRRRR